MSSRVLTPANEITLLRLVFIPVFVILVIDRHYGAALAVLGAAALSDALDGIVARLTKQESPLGVALDPIADKALMTAAYLTFSFRGLLPWWITIMVLSRDAAILVTALLIILVAGYRPFHPTMLGKTSTCFQVGLVFIAMGTAAGVPWVTPKLLMVCIYATGAITVASGIHYLIVARTRFSHPGATPTAAPGSKAEPGASSASSSHDASGGRS